MSESEIVTPFWVRVVADQDFRSALIADPLRALAQTPGVSVSAEQVRQIEEMDLDERREFITEVVREVHMRGAVARFGDIDADGRLGGAPRTD
jgi:hypothetical protein